MKGEEVFDLKTKQKIEIVFVEIRFCRLLITKKGRENFRMQKRETREIKCSYFSLLVFRRNLFILLSVGRSVNRLTEDRTRGTQRKREW